MKIADWFSTVSRKAAVAAGSWQASVTATAIVIAWVLGGFYFGFTSELYQLFINTFTTVTTFIMVFLIQSEQNRSTRALQVKLSEIICALDKANSQMIDIEDATDEQIDAARQEIGAHKNSPQ